jgi:molybdopterin converting factor small subunit
VKVVVRLFAHMRLAAGWSSVALDVPDGSTLGEALEAFDRLHPALAPARSTCMTAIGLDYAVSGQLLKDGDEVSLIPPVQGG